MSIRTWMVFIAVLGLLPTLGCGGGDEGKTDATADSAGDVAADQGGDSAAGTDAGPGGSCETSCLNANKVEDLSLCPKPASDYVCLQGCCAKKVLCQAHADCASKLGTPFCPDDRFMCGCDLTTGNCTQTVCAADAECAKGQLCTDGGCKAKPAGDLSLVLHRKVWIARPGDKGAPAQLLGAQVHDAKLATDPDAAITWKLDGAGFTLGAELVAGAAAGKATLTGTVTGGKASDSAQLWNLGPLPDKVQARLTVVDEESFEPLTGKVWALCPAGAVTPTSTEFAIKDGQASLTGLTPPCDLHVVVADHDAISLLAFDPAAGADLLLATRLHHFAELAYDADGKPIAEATKLVHGDIVSGAVDYEGQGEAGLGITSLGIGSDLLLFNLDALIGPNVTRPFHKDAPALVNPKPGEPQEIPGGVTFFLGKKVIDAYMVAGPPGKHVLWSLAGRLPLSDLMSQVSSIVGAVDGGLDVGKVVGVLLPYLSGFYSQVIVELPFADKSGVQTPISKPLAPQIPLGLTTEVIPPALPSVGAAGFADLMLVLGGALLPDGTLIPLGLAAASDTSSSQQVADGKVDGDQEEQGDQTILLNAAPLHSGLRVGVANRILVSAAINVGGKGKPEGGSIVFSDVGGHVATYTPDAFLPYAMGSKWDAKTRALTVEPVAGAAFYRVVLTGSEGRRWTVLLPSTAVGKALTLPDLKIQGLHASLADGPKRVFVGAFELRGGATTLGKALGDGTFVDLVRRTRRSSFLDVH